MNKAYNMAVALLQFRQAYKNLVDASTAIEDLDVTEGYPFYLLDFEAISPAVLQWCSIHAAKYMQYLPEQVDNPACLKCTFLREGLLPNGLCKGLASTNCNIHPTIPYSQDAVLPYLVANGVNTTGMSSEEIHLIYLRKADEAFGEIQKHK